MPHIPHTLERTALIRGKGCVFHYTCNPPDQEVLDRYGIGAIGSNFGCGDPREVLTIPTSVYEMLGLSFDGDDLRVVSETLLRKLEVN
ncbi:MAG: hypothetical protein KKG75_01910 [Nanoarchaeota archaeon]|nr:hypothetical protein [Nanoarchaeota archaeon]